MIVAAGLILLFWILVALDRRRRWPCEMDLSRVREALRERGGAGEESVAVLVPARNESESLRETLPSLLEQAATFRKLVLVDDRSTDGTADLARELGGASGAGDKLLVVTAKPPPEGWLGKVHALKEGLAGVPPECEWLLLTDADIRHPPLSIAALVELARSEGCDLVSVMVRLRADGFWERLLIPPFVWFFQLLYPFRRVADNRSRIAAAAGGCVLVRRELLERLGGFESIRGEVIDDVSLARRAKEAGGRLWLGLDAGMTSIRGYDTLAEVTRMVARTAFDQLGYRYSLVLGTFAFLGFFFVAPPVLALAAALRGDPLSASAAFTAWLLQSWLFLPAVVHHRVSAIHALALPVASALYAYMTGCSAWLHLRKRGVEWRGRSVTRPPPTS